MDLTALQRAIERVADERIDNAMQRGDFDHLPGRGQPLPDLDQPYDPNWWVRKWTRRQNLSMPELHRELSDAQGQRKG